MAAFKPLILVSFIATCAAFNPLSLSGSVVDHVAHEQLLNVITLEGPASSSSRHRSTRSASTHAVNSSTFTLSGDKHRYGNVFYSGSGSPVVFALMYELAYDRSTCVVYSPTSTLWRSEDYGGSFQKVNLANNKMSRIFFRNPTKPKELLFTDEKDDILYITRDEGKTFINVTVPIDPQTIKFHPTAPDVAMAFKPPGSSHCGDAHGTLYMTLDGGQTWQQRKEAVRSYFWEDKDHELLLSERGNSQQNVTFYYTLDSETQHRIYRSSVLPSFAGDKDIEFDPALGEINAFLLLGQFIFAQTVVDDSSVLYVSSQRRPFKKALIPSPLGHQRYYVDLVRDSQALVIVEHIDDSSPSGIMYNLYLSDSEGASYSLALQDLAYSDTNRGMRFDLEYISGLPGTYIANQFLSGHSGDGNYVRTLISFDGGAEWNFITPPPDVLSNGKLCEPPLCSLHFHMTASANYSRLGVISWDSIPGLIIAHGTAGSKLADKPDLYISRDGGITWQLTLEKAWGVNVMDYGGVIVAAKDYTQEPSRTIEYTCQEGLPGQWQEYTFLNKDIYVWGVVTEPGENSVQSLLFGTEPKNSWEWIVTKLDFQQSFIRKCNSDDYFIWEPWNARVDTEQNCLFGETLRVERRKVSVCCYNGGEYNRVTSKQSCACIPDDYECDWGYKRESGTGGPCVRDPDVELSPATCNGSHLVITKGYRKIAGDHCIGGDTAELEPTVVTCSTASSTTSGPSTMEVILAVVFTVLLLLLIFMIVMLSLMVVYMFKRYRRMRQTYRVLLGGQPRFEASTVQNTEESGGQARLEFNNDEARTPFATDDEPLIDP